MKKKIITLCVAFMAMCVSAQETVATSANFNVDGPRVEKKAARKTTKKTEPKTTENKKGPEWINGIWEVNTVVSTAMGSMRVNAKVCIDRASQQLVATDCGTTVARGIYRINGNSIVCGDLYIDMDMSNQRLEYGSGVYYRKVSNKYL